MCACFHLSTSRWCMIYGRMHYGDSVRTTRKGERGAKCATERLAAVVHKSSCTGIRSPSHRPDRIALFGASRVRDRVNMAIHGMLIITYLKLNIIHKTLSVRRIDGVPRRRLWYMCDVHQQNGIRITMCVRIPIHTSHVLAHINEDGSSRCGRMLEFCDPSRV